jgi:hypothetical protein
MVMLVRSRRSGLVQVRSATMLTWHCSNPLLELWSLTCPVVSSLSGLDTTTPVTHHAHTPQPAFVTFGSSPERRSRRVIS